MCRDLYTWRVVTNRRPRGKSWTLLDKGRSTLGRQIQSKSTQTVAVETDDLSISLGRLLEKTAKTLTIALTVSNGSRGPIKWEVLSIDRRRVQSFAVLT